MKNLFLKKIYGYFRRYDWIILFGLIAVHFFLKDRLRLSSLIFYATPLPLIICFSVLCCYNHRHNKKALYGLLTLTLPLCFFWGISSYKLTESSDKIVCLNKSLNVTFWNIARIKKHPSPALINHLRSINSDIIGCVEAGALTDQAVTDYQNLFPEYSVKNLSGGMLCITKGKIKSVIYMRLPHRSRYNLLEI